MDLIPPEFTSSKSLLIGMISDTHGLLRPEAIAALEGSDVVLHAGDVGDETILERLEEIAPVYTVRGNVDYDYWCGRLPKHLTISLGGLRLHMIHDISYLDPSQMADVSLVVYGHSHRPEIVEREQVLYLNPGSAGPKRFNLPVTVTKLNWNHGKKLIPELIQLL